jgi:hypothetical protein
LTDDEIHEFVHQSVHELMDQNEHLEEKFQIGSYKRYAYDMDKETLAFSDGGPSRIVATIQVAGSISCTTKTWLWGWANSYFPDNATRALVVVREFGNKHGITKLTQEKWEATEEDGWEMSAVCNHLIKGCGVYRCPTEIGFVFLVLTEIKRIQ